MCLGPCVRFFIKNKYIIIIVTKHFKFYLQSSLLCNYSVGTKNDPLMGVKLHKWCASIAYLFRQRSVMVWNSSVQKSSDFLFTAMKMALKCKHWHIMSLLWALNVFSWSHSFRRTVVIPCARCIQLVSRPGVSGYTPRHRRNEAILTA